MTLIIKKAIRLAASLLLLAGPPAFAAKYDHNRETRSHDLVAPTYAPHLPASSSRSDNSCPYIGQWLEHGGPC